MSRLQLLNQIKSVLGHFKFGEFKNQVIPCLPELTWQTVMNEFENNNTPLSIKNIKLILMQKLTNIENDSLRKIYLQLSVVDIALHNTRRVWNSYKMLKPKNISVELDNLCRVVRQGCRLHNIECELQCLKSSEIIWLSIIEKHIKKRGGIIWKPPIYCAYFLDTKYMFLTSSCNEKILNALLHALHYERIKKLQLTGRDVKSLFSLLKKKESRISRDVEYRCQDPIDFGFGIDYTQLESRLTFVESCCNDDTVKLETMTFIAPEGTCKVPGYEDLKMRDTLKLVSLNTFSSMKKMIQESAIDPENCGDLKYLMYKGQNIIKLDNAEV